MVQLMEGKLSDDLVKALTQQAVRRNRSAEQEHREISKAALHGPRKRAPAEVRVATPLVGEVGDFAREPLDRRGFGMSSGTRRRKQDAQGRGSQSRCTGVLREGEAGLR